MWDPRDGNEAQIVRFASGHLYPLNPLAASAVPMSKAPKACSSLSTLLPSLGKLTSRARVTGREVSRRAPASLAGIHPHQRAVARLCW